MKTNDGVCHHERNGRLGIFVVLLAVLAIAVGMTAILSDDLEVTTGSNDQYFTFEVDAENNATITGLTEAGTALEEITIPETVYDETNQSYPVIKIGSNAFYGKDYSFTSVTVNKNVTWIDVGAFSECSSLVTVYVDSEIIDEYAFYGCTGIETLTLGENVSYALNHAFMDCTGLKTIYFNAAKAHEALFGEISFENVGSEEGLDVIFGDEVTIVPQYIFADNENVKSVILGSKVTNSGGNTFVGCFNLTTVECYGPGIGVDMFKDCTGLKTLTLGKNVKSVLNGAFTTCTGLTKINYDAENATFEDKNMFRDAGLEADGLEVVFGETVTKIPDMLFSSNKKLTSITIGSSVTTVGQYAFNECIGMKNIAYNAKEATCNQSFEGCGDKDRDLEIVFGDSVKTIPERMFSTSPNVIKITIGNGVTDIGRYTFGDCSGLTSIYYNAPAATIGELAFLNIGSGASSLEITFGDDVTTIPREMFVQSAYITSLTIGKGVTDIGEAAFAECTGLTRIDFNAVNITTFGNDVFTLAGADDLAVVFGDEVTNIPANIFSGNSKLTSITIGKNVTNIGDGAFAGCSNIKEVTFKTFANTVTVGKEIFSYEQASVDATDYDFYNIGDKDPYVFNGDNVNGGVFNDRTYLYKAEGTLVNHAVISFDPNGGSCTEKSVITDENGKLTGKLPTPTYEGFYFDGWYDGERKITEDTEFSKNITVTAKWKPQFTITFNPNGGECDVKTLKTDAEGKIDGTLPTPTRDGYEFDGWYYNGIEITQDTVFTGNATVTAQWTAVLEPQNAGGNINIALLIVLVLAVLGTLYVAMRRD